MNKTKTAYYFSTEGYSKELPIKCTYVKTLITANNREAVLLDCHKNIKDYKTRYLVIVPRDISTSLFDLEDCDQVFVYVLDGTDYIDRDTIDLAVQRNNILDIGGVAISEDVALKWQAQR